MIQTNLGKLYQEYHCLCHLRLRLHSLMQSAQAEGSHLVQLSIPNQLQLSPIDHLCCHWQQVFPQT